MNWKDVTYDWNQARAFLVTAEEGSLSAAARALGQTQPTLSRQVAGLETALGVTLFERVGKSLALTETGLDMLEHFRAMGEAARAASLTASGRSQEVEGHVTITSTSTFATNYLPEAVAQLRQIAPGILVDLLPSNDVRDLRRREADIAIRHAQPSEPELIARKVGEITAHLYAHADYVARLGHPITAETLSGADFIGFDDHDQMIAILGGLGIKIRRENIRAACPAGEVIVELMRKGLGVSFLTRDMALKFDELEIVWPDMPPITVPVWLVTHRELHTSRRIRLVYDHLGAYLRELKI
ncbi:MAG: LysR family transcriptional regulator [Pseudomonadota bacterium]